MDQSKSSNSDAKSESVEVPPRSLTLEFYVGLFTLITLAAAAYLAMGLGGLQLTDGSRYYIAAEFDNVAGLKYGASVEIAGVKIGEVNDIKLDKKENVALVNMKLDRSIKIRDDDIASIRTKGIIGDRYVKISPGASEIFIEENGVMTETESVVDIEDIIGKIVHSLDSGDDDEDKESK